MLILVFKMEEFFQYFYLIDNQILTKRGTVKRFMIHFVSYNTTLTCFDPNKSDFKVWLLNKI
jgi:hypothetical protein